MFVGPRSDRQAKLAQIAAAREVIAGKDTEIDAARRTIDQLVAEIDAARRNIAAAVDETAQVQRALAEAQATRDRWLPAGTLSLRTSRPGKSARFDDRTTGDIVALWFSDKGAGKSSVSLQIEHLASREAVDERKALWQERLAALASTVGRY